MRRGLIAWSKAELPESVFAARLERLRSAMAKESLDAVVVYTNNTRTAGVSWLTAFVPYWAEGLLVVPRDGDPSLIMAFSNRVVGWGKRVSCVARFEGTPRIGLAAGKYLGTLGATRVGVVDFDMLRAAVASDLADAAPSATLADATVLFERARAQADPAEIELAARAGTIAQRALARIRGDENAIGEALAAAEGEARSAGAEEVYLAAAPDLARDHRFRRIEGTVEPGGSFAVRATIAYKGSWVRMTRTLFRDAADAGLSDRAAEAFAAAVARLPDTGGFAGSPSWLIEGCRTAQPLDPIMGATVDAQRAPAPLSVATAQAIVVIDDRPVAIASPILLGTAGYPASLLVTPIFNRA